MTEKLSDKDYEFIYSKVPRLCVDLVINTDNGIVLTKRAIEPYTGQWHLPGGGVRLEETIEEAVKRIARYELAINIEIVKFLGYIEDFSQQEIKKHSVSLAFLCKIKDGELKTNNHAEEFLVTSKIPETTINSHKEFLQEKLPYLI